MEMGWTKFGDYYGKSYSFGFPLLLLQVFYLNVHLVRIVFFSSLYLESSTLHIIFYKIYVTLYRKKIAKKVICILTRIISV